MFGAKTEVFSAVVCRFGALCPMPRFYRMLTLSGISQRRGAGVFRFTGRYTKRQLPAWQLPYPIVIRKITNLVSLRLGVAGAYP